MLCAERVLFMYVRVKMRFQWDECVTRYLIWGVMSLTIRGKKQLPVQIMRLQSRRSPFLHPNPLWQTWQVDDGVNKCDARAQIVLKDKFNPPPQTFKYDHYLTPRLLECQGKFHSQ